MITFCIYFCVKLGLLQLYPTYVTYKAIKVNEEKELHDLLIFWVVSITYLSLEYFADVFLFWLPFYTELKLLIVLWLILPQTQGAFVTYSHYLDPFLQQNQVYIDNTILDIQERLKEVFVLYGKHLIEFIKASISEMIFKDSSNGKNIDQSQTTKETPSSTYPSSPYQLFSSLVTATANRIQQQQRDTPIDNNKESAELHRTDSQESLHSYIDIHSGLPATNTAQLSWGEYLSSWVVKKPVHQEKKDN